jgi:flagellin
MAQTINTNVISLNAQRNLNASGASLATSVARLSSGLRVNSAKDDAAGLAISERFNTQVRGLTVAARNANDGISLSQVAEGALGKIGDVLQRMRELAVQAGNATNSASDRAALQAEVRQLIDEVDRVAKQTTFNNRKILDGSFSGAVFQVGANSGDTVTLGALVDTRATQLSDTVYAYSRVTGINPTGITDISEITSPTALQITDGTQTFDLGPIKQASTGAERLGQIVEAINRKTVDTGVTAYLTRNDQGLYQLDFMSSKTDTNGDATSLTLSGVTADNFGTTGGVVGVFGDTFAQLSSTSTTTDAIGIDTLTVATQRDAWIALKKIDSAIDQVNSARGDLGALQSRFESTVSNVEIQIENLAAARGRIVDADFAKETANLARTQILQQAGTAMVAQANQLPNQVLQLLQR